jgi:hypothetical protein
LAQLYGAAHGFSLTQAVGGGAVAEVRLPFHVNGEEKAKARQLASTTLPMEATDRAG